MSHSISMDDRTKDDPDALAARLQAALHRHLGAGTHLASARPLTGGAASSTWKIVVATGDARRNLILRRSQGGQAIGSGLDKPTEARVQQAALAAGVPVAPVLFVLEESDGLGSGYAMDCVDGETIPQKLLRDERFATARQRMTAQCAEIAALVHSVPVAGMGPLPELPADRHLQLYEQLYRGFDQPVPIFELALRWLQRRLPADTERCLVHGDFRNGNFIVDPGMGIVALLDWELAHIGDPLEDLGWLCVNSWRFGRRDRPVGGFGEREPLYRAYEQASGRQVDRERVRFWEVFGTLRWGVICQHMCSTHLGGAERSVERAAIGRRISETEIDLLCLLRGYDDSKLA